MESDAVEYGVPLIPRRFIKAAIKQIAEEGRGVSCLGTVVMLAAQLEAEWAVKN